MPTANAIHEKVAVVSSGIRSLAVTSGRRQMRIARNAMLIARRIDVVRQLFRGSWWGSEVSSISASASRRS